MSRPVRVRIAPSPTGDPHVGTAYIALFNVMFARQNGGQFILRIEDTDQSRCTPDSESRIFETLRWLGLDYDEGPDVGGACGPYRQSERLEIYAKHAKQLVDSGAAYRCFCTKDRLDELKALQRKLKQPPGYDGHCRYMDPDEVARRLEAGEEHVVRLKVDKAGDTTFIDRLRGDVVIPNAEVDDQVLLKSDGFPTYHLANVVDDHLMGVTHVIRAEEWISSTPKHVMLYAAFGWELPEFCHMPLLRNADKSKISKRKNPVSLTWYRDVGYLPEALVNFLALQGWSLGDDREKFTPEDMLTAFDLDRVSISGPVFDLEKLGWLNGMYIRELEPSRLRELLDPHMPEGRKLNEERIQQLLPLVQERLRRLDEWDALTAYFHPGPLSTDPESLRVRKKNRPDGEELRAPGEAARALRSYLQSLVDADWVESELEARAKGLLKELGWKPPELFMLIRKAATGTSQTPPVFETLAILGRETAIERLEEAAKGLESLLPASEA